MVCEKCGCEIKDDEVKCADYTESKNTEFKQEGTTDLKSENIKSSQQDEPRKSEKISFFEASKSFFLKCFDFKGRASRSEFWWGYLCYVLIIIILAFVCGLLSVPFIFLLGFFASPFISLFLLLILALQVPLISMQVRRLHDAGKSWVYVLFNLIPNVGRYAVLILCILESDGDNQWGPGSKKVL